MGAGGATGCRGELAKYQLTIVIYGLVAGPVSFVPPGNK